MDDIATQGHLFKWVGYNLSDDSNKYLCSCDSSISIVVDTGSPILFTTRDRKYTITISYPNFDSLPRCNKPVLNRTIERPPVIIPAREYFGLKPGELEALRHPEWK